VSVVLRIILGVLGAVFVGGTISSAIQATVLPRSSHRGLSRMSLRMTRLVFGLFVGRSDDYERRDTVMAMLGPVSLIVLLASWLILALAGFALLYLAAGVSTVTKAIELSGSSVFTLGTTATHTLPKDLISYAEAGVGLLLVTLLITYLPSIYSAFSRRENGVNLLRVRAGTPPRAATLLVRYWIIDESSTRLSDLWRTWEAWFADVEETHTTFAVLPFFRSPQPQQSWITAAGALLDAASLWMAVVEHDPDPDAALCVRAGFQTIRRIASLFRIDFDDDPDPDDPISVSRSEWESALDELTEVGIPVKTDRDDAWRAWKGWRVNYDTALLRLARLVEAPPDVPWVSDRSLITPLPAAKPGRHKRRPGEGPGGVTRSERDAAEKHPKRRSPASGFGADGFGSGPRGGSGSRSGKPPPAYDGSA
jgi:hypothetical protein